MAVVGGGLAGTSVAHALLQQGYAVVHFDRELVGNASNVAAGMFNYVTGKHMKLSWNGLEQAKLLKKWQSGLPEPCKAYVCFNNVIRPFVSKTEQEEWQQKASDDDRLRSCVDVNTQSMAPEVVHNPFGFLGVKAGWIDIAGLMRSLKTAMNRSERYTPVNQLFDYSALQPESGRYAAYTFDQLVFCEGYRANENPFWWVEPLRPLKGEILSLRFIDEQAEALPHILSRGGYMVRRRDGTFSLGTTYGRGQTDTELTLKGRAQLLQKLEGLVKHPVVEILQQQVGIRPTVKDHRPIMGQHPQYARLLFFNGLGNKGLLNTPYMLQYLPDLLAGRLEAIPKAISMWRLRDRSTPQN